MRNYLIAILSCIAFYFNTAPAFCQKNTADGPVGIFDLLSYDEIAEIELELDMDTLMGRKKTDTYTHGRITFERGKKQTMSIPVNVRARGKFRRMKCSFPPLKLKFKKSDLAAHGLNEFNELKLVTHCLDEKEMSKELILREYLVYKMFNLLTPYSFRVQLAKVTYVDTGKKGKKIKSWGILIEDEEDLAQRIGGKKVNRMGVKADSLDTYQENLVSLFQFMISNADWSILLNRNVQLVEMPKGNFLMVPYDFDYSGVVAAPYARPSVELSQSSIRQRVFMGHADTVEELLPAAQYLLSKQAEIQELIDDCPQLSSFSKSDIVAYLLGFYGILKDKKRIKEELLATKKG